MIPLVDLHRHLEGSIRPETSLELATRIGTGMLPAQWRSAFVAAEREEGLLPYLAKIENATALVRTLDDWRRVTAEAVSDAFSDGLAALELRFSPQFIAGVTGLDGRRRHRRGQRRGRGHRAPDRGRPHRDRRARRGPGLGRDPGPPPPAAPERAGRGRPRRGRGRVPGGAVRPRVPPRPRLRPGGHDPRGRGGRPAERLGRPAPRPRSASGTASGAPRTRGCWRTSPPPA